MLRAMIAIVLAVSVSGCGGFFTGIDRSNLKISGKKKEQIRLTLIPRIGDTEANNHIRAYIRPEVLGDKVLAETCFLTSPEQGEKFVVPAAAIPIIVAGAKLAFDLYMDAKLKEIEALKKAAQVSYSEKIVSPEADLRNYGCILLVRAGVPEPVKPEDAKLIVLLHIKGVSNDAFQLEPVYVLAREAVAVTKEENLGQGKKPAINMSFALSVKSLGRMPSGVTGFTTLGEGAISVSDVKIGPQAESFMCASQRYKKVMDMKDILDDFRTGKSRQEPQPKPCPTSDLIAYPANAPWSLTVGVTETGIVGIDFDQATAELKAIKEAIGPALKSSVEKALQ